MDLTAGQTFFDVSAGERTVPGVWHENYWFRRHEVVYEWVAGLVDGQRERLGRDVRVLDAGCGEGYGTRLLARHGPTLALDYDAWTMQHLAVDRSELCAVQGNLVALPLREAAFDVVVSLQTVEHLWDQQRFVGECARVLRPGGLLVLSTPNRLTFPPGNVYHHRELDAGELAALLTPGLSQVQVLGLHHAQALRTWEEAHDSIVDAQIASDPSRWDESLRQRVTNVDTSDFEIDERTDTSIDLLALAVAPQAPGARS